MGTLYARWCIHSALRHKNRKKNRRGLGTKLNDAFLLSHFHASCMNLTNPGKTKVLIRARESCV